MLLFDDPNGQPLDQFSKQPIELKRFLSCGIALAVGLGQLHRRGLVHKDIKPSNVLVNAAMDHAWLMGFGIASRLPRQRQAADPPEFISGTLAYMAPEQTGRMNRSIDSRSDLYALGTTLYELLTGSLPFIASDPMEWIHCHIAKQPLPPAERLKDIPQSISAIICKLLAKTPEERYQTAAGVESDLRRCLQDCERGIHDFPLGEHDRPDRLLIPEKLYGREREIETLLASFDRVVKSGRPELVLVSGYSGIGKSSVVNRLLGEERHVVAPEPGTTRDAIDSLLRYRGKSLKFIDTAGLRRRAKVEDDLEFYSTLRTERAIERAHVCVLVVDATVGMHNQDLRIATQAWDRGAGLIVLVNKWDLIEEKDANTARQGQDALIAKAPFLRYVPFLYVSALTGQRVNRVLDHRSGDLTERRIAPLADPLIGHRRRLTSVVRSQRARIAGQRPDGVAVRVEQTDTPFTCGAAAGFGMDPYADKLVRDALIWTHLAGDNTLLVLFRGRF